MALAGRMPERLRPPDLDSIHPGAHAMTVFDFRPARERQDARGPSATARSSFSTGVTSMTRMGSVSFWPAAPALRPGLKAPYSVESRPLSIAELEPHDEHRFPGRGLQRCRGRRVFGACTDCCATAQKRKRCGPGRSVN